MVTLIKQPTKRTMCLSRPMLLIKVNIPFGQCGHFSQVEPFEKP
jgi:hypothetical protein